MASPQLTVGDRVLPLDVVVRIDGDRAKALDAVRKNGADDVGFAVGEDLYVGSGRGLRLGGLSPGAAVAYRGQEGEIVLLDDQLNTARDALQLRRWLPWVGPSAGVGAASAWAMRGTLLAARVATVAAGTGLAAGTGVGVATAGLFVAGTAIYGATRKVELDLVARHGTVVERSSSKAAASGQASRSPGRSTRSRRKPATWGKGGGLE